MSNDDGLDRIRRYLAIVQPGEVSGNDRSEIESLLSGCWDQLRGSDEGGMIASKLRDRTEEMRWEPPTLSFNIERHGAFVMSSSRAELQEWRIDLDRETAKLAAIRRLQKLPMEKRLDVKALAAETATLISASREDQRLKWTGAGCVRVLTGIVIPANNNQTTTSRRKRFTTELERVLLPSGWRRKKSGTHLVFERAATP